MPPTLTPAAFAAKWAGVTATEIRIGQTTPLSGPAAGCDTARRGPQHLRAFKRTLEFCGPGS